MRENGLAELSRYRELFYFFAWRDVKIRYKQTLLGAAWAVLQPLLTMFIFLILFGRLANIPTNGAPPVLFYYAALVPWIYFSSTVSLCSNSLLSNVNLLTKVYFPRAILPAATALGGLVDLAIASSILVVMMLYYGVTPGWQFLMWPFLAALLMVFTSGLGMLLAALTVKYRDVKYALPFLIQLGLFITPVIYPTTFVPQQYRVWLQFNPLAGIIEAFRSTVTPESGFPWQSLSMSILLTAI